MDPKDQDKETGDKTTKADEQKTVEFDKERQRADQAQANLEKSQAERDALRIDLAKATAEREAQKAKLAELTAVTNAARNAEAALPEINPESATVDDMAAALNATRRLIAEQSKQLAELKVANETQAERVNREARERDQATADDQIFNEVCLDLEDEFGAGLRNQAIELMKKENATKGAPANPAKAVLRLRSCFKQAKLDSEKPKTKDTVRIDGGGGGKGPSFGSPEIKEGSLDEVAKQYKALGASG